MNRVETISWRESDENYYRVVTRLNDAWRVIECCDGIQWILQRRFRAETADKPPWTGRSYCRSSQALRRCISEIAGDIDPTAEAILAALPEWIDPSPSAVGLIGDGDRD
jgi:hypothetical protein